MTDIILTFLVTFAFAVILGPIYIPLLRRFKFGQTIRTDGPATHLKKQGTPTIGGMIFLTPIIPVCIYLYTTRGVANIIPLLWVTVGFGFVGFLDDIIKIIKKRKDGLNWYQKMILLLIVASAFAYYIVQIGGIDSVVFIECFGFSASFDLDWVFIPFCVLVLISSTNAVNLTDGLDGLCGGTSFFVLIFITVASVLVYPDDAIALFTSTLSGGVLGFLLYNLYPARVFMGDTGSLALGGAIGASVIMMRRPFIILLVGMLYVIEALSVILQVLYFKVTRGKRLFRMAPLHHHFELCGWKERKVVAVFWIFTIICCVIAYYSIKGWS